MADRYVEELAGVVALPDHMNDSLLSFARRIRVHIEEEQSRLLPNNALIALLCDAARVGWELCDRAERTAPTGGAQPPQATNSAMDAIAALVERWKATVPKVQYVWGVDTFMEWARQQHQ